MCLVLVVESNRSLRIFQSRTFLKIYPVVVYRVDNWPKIDLKTMYPKARFPTQRFQSKVGICVRDHFVGVCKQKVMRCRCHGYFTCVTVRRCDK